MNWRLVLSERSCFRTFHCLEIFPLSQLNFDWFPFINRRFEPQLGEATETDYNSLKPELLSHRNNLVMCRPDGLKLWPCLTWAFQQCAWKKIKKSLRLITGCSQKFKFFWLFFGYVSHISPGKPLSDKHSNRPPNHKQAVACCKKMRSFFFQKLF